MKTYLNTSISANGCDFLSQLLNDAEHEQGVVQKFDELFQELYKKRVPAKSIPADQELAIIQIPPQGFYVLPCVEKVYLVTFDNFSITLDNQQLGMGLTLEALKIMNGEIHSLYIKDAYVLLRHRIFEMLDVMDGAYTYALLSGSLEYCE